MSPLASRRSVRRPAALGLLAIIAALALVPGDRARAELPRSLAALIPSGAAATLELDDFSALTQRWLDSDLRRGFAKSHTAGELDRSRIYLRLARNLGELEEAAGYAITLERLRELAGHATVFALYDLANTRFVLVSELRGEEARASTWFAQQGKMAPRQHRGIAYLLHEGVRGRPSLAVALVGNYLLAGTALEAFRQALVLTARAAGATVAPPVAGQGGEPSPLSDDPRHQRLRGVAPSAPIHIFVPGQTLASRYYQRYWPLGMTSSPGLSAAWLTFTPTPTEARETRLYLYPDGARPQLAISDEPNARIETSELERRVASLPAEPPFAAVHPTTATDAAQAVSELLPLPPGKDSDAVAAMITGLLDPAHPTGMLELVDPQRLRSGGVQHHGALALQLVQPARLDAARFETTLVQALGAQLGGVELAFRDTSGLRTLELGLVATSEWSFSWRLDGSHLIVASDSPSAARLLRQLAGRETSALLDRPGARLYRLDVARAGAIWQSTTRLLARRSNWSDPSHADWFSASIGDLFDLFKDTRRVLGYGQDRGPSLYVEEVAYLGTSDGVRPQRDRP